MSLSGLLNATSSGDIKDSYEAANGGAVVVAGDSPFTVDVAGSAVVRVDTSAGAITINKHASMDDGAHLKIIDEGGNCGTNIVTITGGSTIQTDNGSIEFVNRSGTLKILEASRELFSRDASTGKISVAETNDKLVADTFENESGTASIDDNGDFTTSGDITSQTGTFGQAATTETTIYADFQNSGANIDSDGTSHGNVYLEGTDLSNGLSSGNYTTTSNSGSGTSEDFFNNDADAMAGSTGGTCYNGADFEVDLGSAQDVNQLRVNGFENGTPDGNGDDCDFYGKVNSGDAWTHLADFHIPGSVAGYHGTGGSSGVASVFNFSTVNMRYFRCTIGTLRNNVTTKLGIDINNATAASSSNTIETETVSAMTIAPASCVLRDETDTAITASGKVNVEYYDGSYATQEDWNTFLARTQNISNVIKLRFQPVGGQRIKEADLVGPAAQSIHSGSSAKWRVDGTDILEANSNEIIHRKQSYSVPVALTSSSNSIAVDASSSNVFTHTTSENTTLENPTNLKAGATYKFIITQSASHTLSFGTAYKFPGGTAPTLTTGASSVDVIYAESDGTNLYCRFDQNMS